MNDLAMKYDPIKGKVSTVFWHYSIPEIAGLLAMSSASLIDSIFIGNYVGSDALATVNLAVPVLTLTWALALLIGAGGSVVCGKFIGENKHGKANEVFTTTMLLSLVASLIFMLTGLFFLDQLVAGLGATSLVMAGLLDSYLSIILWCSPFFIIQLVAFFFIRLAGRPVLASGAFVIAALLNVVLDYIFIAYLDLGLPGAAYATSMSAALVCAILLPYFFSEKIKLTFSKPMADIVLLLKAYANGLSEFANQASIGITALAFNWVMITRLGTDGVAALTVINNIWLMGLFASYGMSDGLQPIISQNFGAGNHKRIGDFLQVASIAILAIGAVMIAAMTIFPHALIGIFLESGETEISRIATEFMYYLWPAFLFVGLNVLITVYFTSMHKPLESTYIAMLRGFALPVAGIVLLPMWFGNLGMYLALPIAEGLTFMLALPFFLKGKPETLVFQDINAV